MIYNELNIEQFFLFTNTISAAAREELMEFAFAPFKKLIIETMAEVEL